MGRDKEADHLIVATLASVRRDQCVIRDVRSSRTCWAIGVTRCQIMWARRRSAQSVETIIHACCPV